MQPTALVHNTLLCAFILSTALHVTAQIVWLTRPQNTVATLGQDLVVNCKAVQEAPSGGQLLYTWLFNQSTVPSKALLMANSSLFVPDMGYEDEGEYTCMVTGYDAEGEVKVSSSAMVVIAYTEDFFIQPESTSAAIGSDAVLTCVTGRSAPSPVVHWEMDGVRMDNAKTLTASFGKFDPTGLSTQISMKLMYRVLDEEVRSFRCVAQNPLSGETVRSLEALVTPQTVDVGPEILSSLPSQIMAREYEQMTLDCEVIGYPPPWVSWFKDADYVDESRAYMLPNGSLVLTRIGAPDAGEYHCEARNRVGKVHSHATLLIVASLGLEFPVEPIDTTALAGNPVTLYCTPPDSIPPASVTWYKDYVPFQQRTGIFAAMVIENGLERNLHFTSVQESDEGMYYCVASNMYSLPQSRTSTIAKLSVQGAPVITEPPINTKVTKGTLLGLSCRVDLATVQSVYWSFGGERVQTSPTVSIVNHGQELWITNVDNSWQGLFTCTAENRYGQKSASAWVTVVVPPVTLHELGPRSVTVNYSILLPCFIYGDPQPVFVWYHDGKLVTQDDRHKLLITGLFIDPVSVDDRGHYSCFGNSSGGEAWSNGTLDVTVPPTADVGPSQVMAVVGDPLTLQCKVEGHPVPSVHWLHNGTSDVAEWSLSPDNTTMTVSAFTWLLSGQYTCVAVNIEDTVMATVTVRTQVKPRVMRIAGKTSVDVHRSLSLTCEVEGVPTPVISWQHKGDVVKASLDGRVSFPHPGGLHVELVTQSDGGQYTCVATSPIGDSSSSVNISIIEPPRPPQLLEAKAMSRNSVFLRWQHVFQAPFTTVSAFIIQYRKRVGAGTVGYSAKISPLVTEKEVDGLEANTEYVFTVMAENSAGRGVSSNSLTAITFQSGPSAPENFHVVSITATTATVSWEIPSQPNGNVQLYQLQYRRGDDTEYSVLSLNSTLSPTQTVVLQKLAPNTGYELRVRAANVWKGDTLWSLYTPLLSLQTNMTEPSAPPVSVQAAALDPFSVHVKWQPVPKAQQHGPITRYKVDYRLEKEVALLGSLTTNSSQFSVTIRGLSPWTWYSLTVEAENPKGSSPKSNVIRVRTDPAAPSSPPQNMEVSAQPGSIVHVDWQPVPAKSRNSDIAVYVVQYRAVGDTAWKELNTKDNQTLNLSVGNVSPWSWYEVRVAAETRQVTPGLGPFTAVAQIHTLQSAAGPVRKVSFNVTASSISLSWSPPLIHNGVLQGYRIDYHPLPLKDAEKGVVVVNTTHALLGNLQAGVMFNITISALNAVGRGNATILMLRTAVLPLPAPSTEESEEADTMFAAVEMTTVGSQTSSASRKLPVIVAGSLTGAAILIILLIILLCRCYRARRETRSKYLIHSSHLQGYGSGSLYRHIEDTSDVIITTNAQQSSPAPPSSSSSASVLSPQQQQQEQEQDRNGPPRQLADPAWLSQQAHSMDTGVKGAPVYLPVGGAVSEGAANVSLSPQSGDREVFTVQGIDNPGFTEDKLHLPGLSPAYDPPLEGASASTVEEGVEQRTSTLNRKKGRMRSESAAAIAVLRSTHGPADDTQFLLNNEFANVDSEVVFKHRTVL